MLSFVLRQGTLYLEGQRGSEERASIVGLHDDDTGVIIAEKCSDAIHGYWPKYDELCEQLLPRYNAYSFDLLMNSTFGLLPSGGSPGTHRLAEASSTSCFLPCLNEGWLTFGSHVCAVWRAISFKRYVRRRCSGIGAAPLTPPAVSLVYLALVAQDLRDMRHRTSVKL